MAIDITNKNEKQIALTGTQIEETLLQAHLSKDAIEKISGLKASASEIDGAVANNLIHRKQEVLTSAGDFKLTDFVPHPDKSFRIVMTLEKSPTTKSFTMNGIGGNGGNDRILIGTANNGISIYTRLGNLSVYSVRANGKCIVELYYNGKSKKGTIMVSGRVEIDNQPCVLVASSVPFGIGGKTKLNLTPEPTEIMETDVISCFIYENIDSKPLSLQEQRNLVFNDIPLIAHRGFAGLSPENTLSAFKNCIGRNIKHLECDVQITKDGVPVIIHDLTIDRTSNGTGNVKDLTHAELNAFDFGSYFSAAYENERIPTFDEFCKLAVENDCIIYPEIKGYRTQSDINLMLEVVIKYGLLNKCVFQGFNHGDLIYLNGLNGSAILGYLSSSLINKDVMLPNSYALIAYSSLKGQQNYIDGLHTSGLKVGVWTVDTYIAYEEMLNLGVDGIMCNYNLSK